MARCCWMMTSMLSNVELVRIVLILSLLLTVRCDQMIGHRSLADRLLALWTNSGESRPEVSLAMFPSALPLRQQPVNNELELNEGQSASSNEDSLKKVLEFLSAKAAVSSGNKKLPEEALKGLEALASGTAKTPRPIDLTRASSPMDAVLGYFHELGIDDVDCRKRTICELLTEPQAGYGIFGELLGFVFGSEELNPKWTKAMDREAYRGYREAVVAGRRMLECDQIYGVCRNSYKEYIKLSNVR